MEKIKKVTLAKDYNNGYSSVKAGAKLQKDKNSCYFYLYNENDKLVYCFPDSGIRENTANLFSIEYEDTENEALAELITFTKDIQEKYSETNVTEELKKIINKLLYNTQ